MRVREEREGLSSELERAGLNWGCRCGAVSPTVMLRRQMNIWVSLGLESVMGSHVHSDGA